MKVVTRFAPSPTGDLHIGGLRTAIINWIYAMSHHGEFKLRIEDTDADRSSQNSINHILESMDWIGIHHDGNIVYQSERINRHVEIANHLLSIGRAYEDNGAIRICGIKKPQRIDDLVQGTVKWPDPIDDFVILRSDGTPTYMLASVVDDYDMGVTHVIRGDDHLNNAFRQLSIYDAMNWSRPVYAHIPLIHGEDGKKLSKRSGAAGIDYYRKLGIVSDAMFSYLVGFGWGHGDNDTINRSMAVSKFSLDKLNRSPSRIDIKKLTNINFQTMQEMDVYDLSMMAYDRIVSKIGRLLTINELEQLRLLVNELLPRSKTVEELANGALFLFDDNIEMDEKALNKFDPEMVKTVLEKIDSVQWDAASLHQFLLEIAAELGLNLIKVIQPIRIALTGSTISPGIGEVMTILGKYEVIKRMKARI